MSLDVIRGRLDQMAAESGVRGCALVDAATGMIWLASTNAALHLSIWEAAVDYWRLHERHKRLFTELGPLRAAVMHHASGLLAILPCTSEPELLLVAHGAQKRVDWRAWQEQVRQIGQLIRNGP
ncbi:MAG TPA: hypothetical protein VGM74_18795 [Burkholderiaceae bacterium]|jgi:hypothetical protein